MAHDDPNYVAENPFEGRGRASQRNDAIDAGVGFGVSFVFFAAMFIIAMIVSGSIISSAENWLETRTSLRKIWSGYR